MIAAAAAQQGIPVYVMATRQVGRPRRGGAARPAGGRGGRSLGIPPEGVLVRNPYFEPTPLELVASLITDIGVVGSALAADICEAVSRDQPPDLIDKL